MSATLIANRYARALLKMSESDAGLALRAENFLNACESLFEVSEAKKILKSPVMPQDVKKALLAYAAETSGAGKEFTNFAAIVVEAGRTTMIPDISRAFKHMLAEKRGVAEATATTAEPLSSELSSELNQTLEKVFKKKITLRNEVDKKVLGGVVVSVGNYTIDLSLKSRLNSVADFAQR
jgi:F-type H+-transporting ATPase subunit delta